MSIHARCAVFSVAVLGLVAAPRTTRAIYETHALASVIVGSSVCNDQEQDAGPFPAVHAEAGCAVPDLGSGSANAHADLRTGSLGVRFAASSGGGTATATTFSSLLDHLEFSVPGGIGSGESILIGVTFTINGQVGPGTTMSIGSDSYLDYTLVFYDNFLSDHNLDERGSLTVSPSTGPYTFAKSVQVSGPFPRVEVLMELQGGGGIVDGSVDFDLVTIELDLPPGVTFTSESGAFLTAPEPGTAALAAASVAALGALARRRARG